MIARILAFAAGGLAGILTVAAVVSVPSLPSLVVVDGDTVRLGQNGSLVRLVGLNAPETRGARCAAERDLGERAKERLSDLVGQSFSLRFVPCACEPGTEGTKACNFGRSCGILSVDGKDVAETLVEEGLAVPFVCGDASCPRLPRPWCGQSEQR